MVAVIIIGIAMIPAALFAIWFLLPWVSLLVGLGAIGFLIFYKQSLDPSDRHLLGWVGIGGFGAGMLLLMIQGYIDWDF
jgi:hypothetical protein